MVPSAAEGSTVVGAGVHQPVRAPDLRQLPPVVLVDDDKLALDGMAALLVAWGYEVLTAADWDTALRHLSGPGPGRAPWPAIVIVDLNLGGRSGLDLLAAAQTQRPGELTGIIVTGATDQQALRRVSGSIWPVLHKPVRPRELRAALAKVS